MAFSVTYSWAERLFHRIAFAAPFVQMAAEDIESSTFGRSFRHIDASRPIFITSLPRAGTTMMLEVLSQLPGLACTTYRDMPFVMAPLLRARLSGSFRKSGELRERAHGDGVRIGYDSPEGFEEVIWRAHWPDHYEVDCIRPWSAAHQNREATAFLTRHMQKIISLRRPGQQNARYLSKNNANIARLELIAQMFPEARILLLLRDPLEHAASLHRQHRNFSEQQGEDPFVARYMRDIGHFEFGKLHKPIRSGGFEALTEGLQTDRPDYWLAYWISAFEAVEAARQSVGEHLIIQCYERLCAEGVGGFAAIAQRLGLSDLTGLEDAAAHVRPARPRADAGEFDPGLAARARAIHARLGPAG